MMTSAPMESQLARQVSQFVRRRGRIWRRATNKALREYFDWFYVRGLLSVIFAGGQVGCVMTGRFFSSYADYRREFVHDPFGPLCQVRVYGALSSRLIVEAAFDLVRRHDPHRIFLWNRQRDDHAPPKVYTYAQLMRLLGKLNSQ